MNKNLQKTIPKLHPQESETIVLYSVIKALDSMASHLFILLSESEHGTVARFKTSAHAAMFNSLLSDFLTDKANLLIGSHATVLQSLLNITQNPSFNQYNTTDNFKKASLHFES